MKSIFVISLIGLSIGIIGTGLGGIIAFFMKNPSNRCLSFILGATSGLMLSIVCFDLLPEAFELGQLYVAISGIIMGVFTIMILETGLAEKNEDFTKTGILLGIGIALHNFPEGLAIGAGFMATKELGIGISIVIGLHNMPEGIAMATPLRVGGMGRLKVFLYTIFAGMPIGLGAFIGAFLGEISKGFVAFCLAYAAGTMLYITCEELIPNSLRFQFKRVSSFGFVFGFIVGIILSQKL
ncbi:ZIP family metal transporter [Marinisporobacter balticus]|uniref:ZIP family zinc transporter n=1 Tax=Marinisporobacter balticus TaxID=2018667 RepID=A0A4R2KXV8_9FIRM|nr:ZIP family metal transporter [Marinisporobacter balticus]TCO78783.1 ZIP family zinc transporter [Marinisporobacter balticus]